MSDNMRSEFEEWFYEQGFGHDSEGHMEMAWQAAIQSLPRITEEELAETIYNDVYDSNFDISRLAANILAKFIAAKFPQIIKE